MSEPTFRHAFSEPTTAQPAKPKSVLPSPLECLVLIGITALLVSVLMPTTTSCGYPTPGRRCEIGMRHLAMSLLDHRSTLPDTLDPLLDVEGFDPHMLLCPLERESGRADVTTAATVVPGFGCSYGYLGGGFTYDDRLALQNPPAGASADQVVLLYELPDGQTHPSRLGPTLNVLYADFHTAAEPVAVVAAIHRLTLPPFSRQHIVVDDAFRAEAEKSLGTTR